MFTVWNSKIQWDANTFTKSIHTQIHTYAIAAKKSANALNEPYDMEKNSS